jgi:lipoprotein-anchoring transpeptidase ErfK/SrfK
MTTRRATCGTVAGPAGSLPGVLRRASRPFLCALALAIALSLAACGGGGGSATLGQKPATTAKAAIPKYTSYIATAKSTVTQVAVYDSPDATQPSRKLDNPWLVDPTVPTSKVTQVFLVKEQRPNWAKVLLPVRPNGSTGWVKTSDVTITTNPFAIKVALGAHTITVTNGNQVIYAGKVAVGATDPPLPDAGKPTPTPTGEYYLRVLLQAPDPNTVYGPYAYGLSSHSDTLDEFAGGDAEIGIHGNNDPSVLGTNATHGCVRMDNAAITMLSKQLPLGTPVDIVA